MSRGMGKMQRAIMDYLTNHHYFEPCELSWLITEVHENIIGERETRPPRAFVVSVRRAVNELERKGLVMSGYSEGYYTDTNPNRRYYSSRSCSALVKYVWTPETDIKDGWCSYINRDAARAGRDAMRTGIAAVCRARAGG